LLTWPLPISAARPTSPLPVLLLITVRSVAPWSISAWSNSIGLPDAPNPPTITVAPSGISATASATDAYCLLITSYSS
jgi:hypothetical protein